VQFQRSKTTPPLAMVDQLRLCHAFLSVSHPTSWFPFENTRQSLNHRAYRSEGGNSSSWWAGTTLARTSQSLSTICDGRWPKTFPYSRWRCVMRTITTDELKVLRDQNGKFTLVNTLGPEAFEKTRIPGAINVPLDNSEFVARVEQQAGGKDKPVVVYCASQQCNSSEKAAKKLEEAGFTRFHATRAALQLGIRKPRKCKRDNAAKHDAEDVPESSRRAAPHRAAALGLPRLASLSTRGTYHFTFSRIHLLPLHFGMRRQ
jgi:rhodanese-related sulfurtransferase